MIRKIGLTGGIGSGKSRVADMLAQGLGCVRVDADAVCRHLLQPHAEGWREISAISGEKYLTPDRQINRALLRKDLFADEEFRCRVNQVIHPLARKRILAQMDEVINSGPATRILVEVPLLYEVHWEDLFDTVVVVYADYQTCLDRLMKRDGLEKREAEKELESQLPLAEKTRQAGHIIDNSGSLQDTRNQVQQLVKVLAGEGKPHSRG
jgi:dephospho-CoA kinase